MPGHGLHQAQTQPDAGRVTTGIAAEETLRGAGTLRGGHSGAGVGDHDAGGIPRRAQGTHRHGAARRAVLERIVDEIVDGLCQQYLITGSVHGPGLILVGERDVLHLRGRHVELDRARTQVAQVHIHEPGAAHAGVNLGQSQQGVEDADDAIDIRDRRVDLGKRLGR